jgi:hypothetical protein
VLLTITVGGRTVTAELNAKSLRRCIAAITEAGADGCGCSRSMMESL